jgi:hypothetical protein
VPRVAWAGVPPLRRGLFWQIFSQVVSFGISLVQVVSFGISLVQVVSEGVFFGKYSFESESSAHAL